MSIDKGPDDPAPAKLSNDFEIRSHPDEGTVKTEQPSYHQADRSAGNVPERDEETADTEHNASHKADLSAGHQPERDDETGNSKQSWREGAQYARDYLGEVKDGTFELADLLKDGVSKFVNDAALKLGSADTQADIAQTMDREMIKQALPVEVQQLYAAMNVVEDIIETAPELIDVVTMVGSPLVEAGQNLAEGLGKLPENNRDSGRLTLESMGHNPADVVLDQVLQDGAAQRDSNRRAEHEDLVGKQRNEPTRSQEAYRVQRSQYRDPARVRGHK